MPAIRNKAHASRICNHAGQSSTNLNMFGNSQADNVQEIVRLPKDDRLKMPERSQARQLISIEHDKFEALLKLLGIRSNSLSSIEIAGIEQEKLNASGVSKQPLQKYFDTLDKTLQIHFNHLKNPNDRSLLIKFCNDIQNNYQDPDLRRGHVAHRLNISERQLNRKLNQHNIATFATYLMKYRLKQALLLIDTGLQVSQLGEKVGFSNTPYFCSSFKLEFDITVNQLRAALRQQTEVELKASIK